MLQQFQLYINMDMTITIIFFSNNRRGDVGIVSKNAYRLKMKIDLSFLSFQNMSSFC